MTKFLLPFALFFLTCVEGKLRGDLSHDDKRDLKKCKSNCNPVPASMPAPMQPTQPTAATSTQATQAVPAPTPTPPSPAAPTVIDICQETTYWKNADVVPCTTNAMCKDYQTKVGNVCCLKTRCICGSDANGADSCGYFGGASFASGITVPSVNSPTTQAIQAVPAPTTPAATPATPAATPAATAPTPAAAPTPATAPKPPAAAATTTAAATAATAPTVTVPTVTSPTSAAAATPATPATTATTPAATTPASTPAATPATTSSAANLGAFVASSSSGYDTCGVTSYQSATLAKTVPCFKASDCANYKPNFGTGCCLASRCICGSTAETGASRCANFAPTSASGVTTSSTTTTITVPTITVPTVTTPSV